MLAAMRRALLILAVVMVVGACGKKKAAPTTPQQQPAPATEADKPGEGSAPAAGDPCEGGERPRP